MNTLKLLLICCSLGTTLTLQTTLIAKQPFIHTENETALEVQPTSIIAQPNVTKTITVSNIGNDTAYHMHLIVPAEYAPYLDSQHSILSCEEDVPVDNTCALTMTFLDTLPAKLATAEAAATADNAASVPFTIQDYS